EHLIAKDDAHGATLPAGQQEALAAAFKSCLPKIEKTDFNVDTHALGENAMPVTITQSEYMRRMKDMANIQAGMSFYGDMPDMFTLVLNSDHKLIKQVLTDEEAACTADVAPIQAEMDEAEHRRSELNKSHEKLKADEIPQADKDELTELDKKRTELKNKKDAVYAAYAAQNMTIRQLIDLALLQNNMLKGEALNQFVRRTMEKI
ncbi:MAG: molecular chaperone HtpG, partial [Prevotellaceae bacterium]|nr:molecular chaperone HtpG [Prevotellaceae bacterium]